MTQTGLDRLLNEKNLQDSIKGKIGYLCHGASIDNKLNHGILGLKKIFGERLIKLFGPQHGFKCDVQDNMIETDHFDHPYFNLKIYSLYSDTREMTDEMLDDLDTIIIDLQDIGTRIYTYIYTMTLILKKCANRDINIVILDRPNPISGEQIEGNILDTNYASFVGLHPIPVRHGLTMAEMANLAKNEWYKDVDLSLITMNEWKRSYYFEQTSLPFVTPSPNIPNVDSTVTFPTTVYFEGTNISEGRGTTKSLELFGHPKIEPFQLEEKLNQYLLKHDIQGIKLRPTYFLPTFQKHANSTCGGYQIHVLERKIFKPFLLGQVLLKFLYHEIDIDFKWKQPPYEYEKTKMPIDIINGTDKLRKWVEKNQSIEQLYEIEQENQNTYLSLRSNALLY